MQDATAERNNIIGAKAHPAVFPYLVTRVTPDFYHITVLPKLNSDYLFTIAFRQHVLNDLPTCLVTGPNAAIYINGRGKSKINISNNIPAGGSLVAEKLEASVDLSIYILKEETFMGRCLKLLDATKVVLGENANRYLFGDLTKGGRTASESEQSNYDQKTDSGVPYGLNLCKKCGDYRGVCLDPSSNFQGQLMTVSCLCENKNKCGRCHELLFERKLNANFYDPSDNNIWHVPAFSGFSHICKTVQVVDGAK